MSCYNLTYIQYQIKPWYVGYGWHSGVTFEGDETCGPTLSIKTEVCLVR